MHFQLAPPLLPLNMNVAPSTADKAPKKIKTKKLRLPHPCSLDVLPSPIDKWSTTTRPIKAWVIGYLGYHISYKHFYFHQSRILLTKAFATSTTASTVGNGGMPKGSTELDAICGPTVPWKRISFICLLNWFLGFILANNIEPSPANALFSTCSSRTLL